MPKRIDRQKLRREADAEVAALDFDNMESTRRQAVKAEYDSATIEARTKATMVVAAIDRRRNSGS